MAGSKPESDAQGPSSIGLLETPALRSVTGIDILAIALSVIWLVVVGVLALMRNDPGADGSAALRSLMTLVVVVLPLAMIWLAATVLRASRAMQDESRRLHMAIDGLRQSVVAQAQRGAGTADSTILRRLDEIATDARKTQAMLATLSAAPESAPSPTPKVEGPADEPPVDQGSLPLGTPAEALSPPLPTQDLLLALNFPEDSDDAKGFGALRRALRDRKAAQVIQASQDVLTLLSQEGIYMDDLRPDVAPPDVWRQFAQGKRGRSVSALGGVRDRTSLALTAGRMKQDPIFRDAAHHFLRLFDRMLADFATHAPDADISALGETRTARAFMLLGRVAGTFD